ncbi:hypothetical protein PFI31113_03851 [Pandoraea fibrosis]|uniref:Uncharacterized protein n=1 Tax=Pandoraea fibrosis TaxID=1891094 RepID=A0A5E4XHP5_9BURK|nr:hypothetical protein PFI31113_03851 [Pandoraea fibrosis]
MTVHRLIRCTVNPTSITASDYEQGQSDQRLPNRVASETRRFLDGLCVEPCHRFCEDPVVGRTQRLESNLEAWCDYPLARMTASGRRASCECNAIAPAFVVSTELRAYMVRRFGTGEPACLTPEQRQATEAYLFELKERYGIS